MCFHVSNSRSCAVLTVSWPVVMLGLSSKNSDLDAGQQASTDTLKVVWQPCSARQPRAAPDLNVKTEWEREVSGASNTSVLTFTNRGEIKESAGDESQQHKTKSKGIATEYFKRSETDADSFTLKGKVLANSEKSLVITVCQGFSRKILRNKMFAHFMVVIVVLDAFLTATDIDFRARGETPPGLVLGLSTMCLCLYALELLFQVFARGGLV